MNRCDVQTPGSANWLSELRLSFFVVVEPHFSLEQIEKICLTLFSVYYHGPKYETL